MQEASNAVLLSEISSLRRLVLLIGVLILIGLTLNGTRVYQATNTVKALRKQNACLQHLIDTNRKGYCRAQD
jgi:hypothetical protein